MKIETFGMKYRRNVEKYKYVFDMRMLDNPFYIEGLKNKNGLDDLVYRYVLDQVKTKEYLSFMENIIKENINRDIIIGIFCTGGQHRSVSVGRYLSEKYNIEITHLELSGLFE